MKVKYVGGLDFFDGLTTNEIYTVFEETYSSFVIKNDSGGASIILKHKFEILDKEGNEKSTIK